MSIRTSKITWQQYIQARSNSGDWQALEWQILQENQKLVWKIANNYGDNDLLLIEELFQVGIVKLLERIRQFDPERGSLASFAMPAIRGAVQQFLRDKAHCIRKPRLALTYRERARAAQKQAAQFGIKIDEAKGAEAAGVTSEDWQWAQDVLALPRPCKFDESLHTPEPEGIEDTPLERNALHTAIAQLPELHHTLIRGLYFQHGSRGKRLRELTRQLSRQLNQNFTLQDIEAIEQQALTLLKTALEVSDAV